MRTTASCHAIAILLMFVGYLPDCLMEIINLGVIFAGANVRAEISVEAKREVIQGHAISPSPLLLLKEEAW